MDDVKHVEPAVPILPEDVPPPPSYEEVMGQYMTSVNSQQALLPTMAYIDIMPRLLRAGSIQNKMPPTFQTFTEVVDGANIWLRDNPGLCVWKCETVERKVEKSQGPGGLTVNLQTMQQRESAFGFNCYVFGLRLWLTQRPADQRGDQELGLINVMPTEKEIDVTMHYRYGARHGPMGFRGVVMSQPGKMISYEGLRKSLEDFNKRMKTDPIPGTILNIESTTLKFSEGFKIESTTDVANASSWHELNSSFAKRFTQILRVYYIKGSPTTPEIKVHDVLPQQLTQPSMTQQVKFADFNSLLDDTGQWIRQQNGIRIVNMETRDVKLQKMFNEVMIDTDSSDDFQFTSFHETQIRFIRLIYITDARAPPYSSTTMTSRLFVPARLTSKQFETMTQTMTRIDAWMRLTDLPILGVETVQYLMTTSALGINAEPSTFNIQTFSGKEWITAIRVYFPTAFEEPPAALLPPLPVIAPQKSSTCTIL